MNRRSFIGALGALGAASLLPAACGPDKSLEKSTEAGLNQEAPVQPTILQVQALPLDGLSEKARLLAATKINSTVLELDVSPGGDVFEPHYMPECLLKNLSDTPCQTCKDRRDWDRNLVLAQYFCIACDNGPDGLPDPKAVQAVLRAFGRLADTEVINYGVLAPPSLVPLYQNKSALFFYVFPDLRYLVKTTGTTSLNKLLGEECFVKPGEISDKGAGLLCSTCPYIDPQRCPECLSKTFQFYARLAEQYGIKELRAQVDWRSLEHYNRHSYSISRIVLGSSTEKLPTGHRIWPTINGLPLVGPIIDLESVKTDEVYFRITGVSLYE